MAQRSTLANLAALAGLFYGTKQRRRDVKASNREEMAVRLTDQKHKESQLAWQREQETGRQAGEDADRKQRERTARLSQLRAAYTPLLQAGRTPEDQAWLSANPGMLQALRDDQSDITNLLAGGDDGAWETFRPRYYGGQGHVPQQTGPGMSGIGPGSQAPPVGAPAEGMGMDYGPFGAPMGAPSAGMVPPPSPQAPQQQAPPQGAPPPATRQPAPWLTGALPLPAKTQAKVDDTKSRVAERDAKLQPELDLLKEQIRVAHLNGDKAGVEMALKKAQTVIAQGTPAWRQQQHSLLEKALGVKVNIAARADETDRLGIRTTAATAAAGQKVAMRGQDLNAANNNAIVALRRELQPHQIARLRQQTQALQGLDPTTKAVLGTVLDYATGSDSQFGMETPHTPEQISAAMGMLGPLVKQITGRDINLGGGGAAAAPRDSAPAAPAGGGIPAGFSQEQVNAISRIMETPKLKQLLAQAGPEEKAQIMAVIAHIRKQRGAKGKK